MQTGHGVLGRCPAAWKGGPIVVISSYFMLSYAPLTTAFQVTAAEDMAATRKVESRYKALFGVDTI
jgi:hypothetical protein